MIEFRNLSYSYLNGKGGIKNISLKINDGEFVVFCGKSGCGKTTLTRIINGLAFHFYKGMYSGEAYINGRDISEIPSSENCLNVGSVFQDPRSQFFDKYVEGEIAFGCENIGFTQEIIRKNTEASIRELSIERLRSRKLLQLSSGEKQKTAIASIYAMMPNIYVLDEPSSNLDKKATKELAEILKKLKASGKTVIVAEHRISYLADLADRFIHIRDNNIVEEFSPDEFWKLSDVEISERGLRSRTPSELKEDCVIDNNSEKSCDFEIRNLAAAYKEPLFTDFCLSAERGDVVAVLGANGEGKTTLCRIISGIKKAKKGEVRLNGKLLSKRQRLKNTFLVLNGSDNRTFTDRVSAEPLFGLTKKEIQQKQSACDALLKELNLKHLSSKHPLTLSGGQKQRLSIVTALIQDKDVIIFDEPTSGLDYENMIQVAAAIQTAASKGKIVLVVSHDIEFINCVANKVVRI